MAGGRGRWEEADTCFFSYSDFPSSQQAHGLEGILPATCHCAQEPGGLPSPPLGTSRALRGLPPPLPVAQGQLMVSCVSPTCVLCGG